MEKFSKKYQCNMCQRIFDQVRSLKAHIPTCCTDIQEIYVGGKFRPKETVFDWLEKEDFNVPESDRYFKYFSVFDFEALQEKGEEIIKK